MSGGPLFRKSTLDACSKLQRHTWHLVDARDQVVGRLAANLAQLLTGKHRPDYHRAQPEKGDTIVVINAEKVKFTGKKWKKKLYRRHSQYPGGLKEIPAHRMLEEHPSRILNLAVKGMLPANQTRSLMLSKLKVYTGEEHPHEAQFKVKVRQQTAKQIPDNETVPENPMLKELDIYWRIQEKKRYGEELPIR